MGRFRNFKLKLESFIKDNNNCFGLNLLFGIYSSEEKTNKEQYESILEQFNEKGIKYNLVTYEYIIKGRFFRNFRNFLGIFLTFLRNGP